MKAVRASFVSPTAVLAAVLGCATVDMVRAENQGQFQGAWAAESFDCAAVFATKGGRMVFEKTRDDTLPGFIVAGDRIHGKTTSCSVSSLKRTGDVFAALLECQSQIMFGMLSVSFRLKDGDTLERFDKEFPDIRQTYHRCGK